MGKVPRVSVVITCYNYGRFLADAVESVVGQGYRDFEIIIVDDGSTDNTGDVALGLMDRHAGVEIRYARQANSGAPAARNRGAALARGEYLVQLDADDMLRHDFIEKLVPLLDASPIASFAYSWSEFFGDETGTVPHDEFTLHNMLTHRGPHNTSLIRKSGWDSSGGHNPAMSKGFQDWEFYLGLFEAGHKGALLPEPLHLYRRHGPSISGDVARRHSLLMMRTMRLLHPRLFEPFFFGISPELAKAVIWVKYYTRDRVSHYIYKRLPWLHKWLRAAKYGRVKG